MSLTPTDDDSTRVSSHSIMSNTDSEENDRYLNPNRDIESQPLLSTEEKDASPAPVAAEYSVSTNKKLAALAAYFALNLGLTLYNKAMLGQVSFISVQATVARKPKTILLVTHDRP